MVTGISKTDGGKNSACNEGAAVGLSAVDAVVICRHCAGKGKVSADDHELDLLIESLNSADHSEVEEIISTALARANVNTLREQSDLRLAD